MIGDRAEDIRAATTSGLASVGVLRGFGTREELLDAGADTLIERIDDLLDLEVTEGR